MKGGTGKRLAEDPLPAWAGRRGLALLTDLYELTMFAGYLETGIDRRRACFEYFFRELPPHTGFAVFAGLDGLIDALEAFRFNRADLDYLRGLKLFSKKTIDRLAGFRPELDLFAPPEGSVVFPHEPIVRVEGPLADAQLIETLLLNLLNYPTLIATRAARVSLAALGDPVMEFGLRRAQGPDGGLSGSRAAFIGGCGATSNLLAGRAYGIPVRGTHAHSWVMSHPSELEAFRQYVKIFPGREMGGPGFVKAVLGPTPWSRLVPTGLAVEYSQEDINAWFKAGVAAVPPLYHVGDRYPVRSGKWVECGGIYPLDLVCPDPLRDFPGLHPGGIPGDPQLYVRLSAADADAFYHQHF